MADTKISELPQKATPVTGDVVPILDSASGNANKRTTVGGIVVPHVSDSDPHAQYQLESAKGVANGYASLGADGLVPDSQLPVMAGGAGGDVQIADGDDETQGLINDAAVAAGAVGTISAKLRAISRDIGALLGLLPSSLGQKNKAGSLSVTIASDEDVLAVSGTVTANAGSGPFPMSDNGGSITVDAPAGTPVAVRLSDGAAPITTLPVSVASVPSHAVTNAGTFAVQATEADGANATIGAKADAKSTATDTTAVSMMSVMKQISASLQILAVGTRARPTTTARRNVTASATAVDLFPAATNYQPGSHALNNTSEPMYINEDGTNPTTSVYGDVVNPGEVYVMDVPINNLAVRVIWPSANGGAARCTDFTS